MFCLLFRLVGVVQKGRSGSARAPEPERETERGTGRQGATGGAGEGNPTGKSQKIQKKLKKVCDFAKKIIVFCRGEALRKT